MSTRYDEAAARNGRTFTLLLVNTGVSGVVTSFLWFALTFWVYLETKSVLTNPFLWVYILVVLGASIADNLRGLAMVTCVSLLIPPDRLDKANGQVGMSQGLSFAVTSVFSGLVIGRLGMGWAIGITIALTVVALLHVLRITIPYGLSLVSVETWGTSTASHYFDNQRRQLAHLCRFCSSVLNCSSGHWHGRLDDVDAFC